MWPTLQMSEHSLASFNSDTFTYFVPTAVCRSLISLLCWIPLTPQPSASSTEVLIHLAADACTHLAGSGSTYKYTSRRLARLLKQVDGWLNDGVWTYAKWRAVNLLAVSASAFALSPFAVVPVRKVHALNITWALPPQEKYYRWAEVQDWQSFHLVLEKLHQTCIFFFFSHALPLL